MVHVNALPTQASPSAPPRIELQRHYVDGAFRESVAGGTFETVSPTTGEVLGPVADGQAADIDAAVAAARRAFDEGPWPRLSAAERAAALRRVAALLREPRTSTITRA